MRRHLALYGTLDNFPKQRLGLSRGYTNIGLIIAIGVIAGAIAGLIARLRE